MAQSPLPPVPQGTTELGIDIIGQRFPMHPMKGAMVTQTLQDIINHEPLHWRGDRFGLEEFNGAFPGLLGRATGLTAGDAGRKVRINGATARTVDSEVCSVA